MSRFIVSGLSLILSLSLALWSWLSQAQQPAPTQPQPALLQLSQNEQAEPPAPDQRVTAARVDISTTISGNQQQPRTLYVLPWQDSIAQIRIPAPGLNIAPTALQPLDRQQFLRFIEAQSLSQQPASTASTKNN